MDARELNDLIRGITDELPGKLLQNKGFETLASALCRIASYLQSEQNERIKHQKAMMQFDRLMWGDKDDIEGRPGIAHEISEIRKKQDTNEKRHESNRRILIGLVFAFLGKFAWELFVQVGHNIKP